MTTEMKDFYILLGGVLDKEGQPLSIKASIGEVFSPADRAALMDLVKGHRLAIDVGSFTGASAHAMLSGMDEQGRIICVDHFTGIKTASEAKDDFTATVQPWLMYMALQVRLAEFTGRFNIFNGSSNIAQQYFKPGLADFVFIDASHAYGHVAHDIDRWLAILGPGGVMAGHDFDKHIADMPMAELKKYEMFETIDEGYHPGVVRAVRERFTVFGLAEDEDSSIWWAKKEDARCA